MLDKTFEVTVVQPETEFSRRRALQAAKDLPISLLRLPAIYRKDSQKAVELLAEHLALGELPPRGTVQFLIAQVKNDPEDDHARSAIAMLVNCPAATFPYLYEAAGFEYMMGHMPQKAIKGLAATLADDEQFNSLVSDTVKRRQSGELPEAIVKAARRFPYLVDDMRQVCDALAKRLHNPGHSFDAQLAHDTDGMLALCVAAAEEGKPFGGIAQMVETVAGRLAGRPQSFDKGVIALSKIQTALPEMLNGHMVGHFLEMVGMPHPLSAEQIKAGKQTTYAASTGMRALAAILRKQREVPEVAASPSAGSRLVVASHG